MSLSLHSLLASAPCQATYPTHRQALAARKRLYRLGAKDQGLRLRVQGCELILESLAPVALAARDLLKTPTPEPNPPQPPDPPSIPTGAFKFPPA